jgi:hypothetical protein
MCSSTPHPPSPPRQPTGIHEHFAAGTAFLAANVCNTLQQHSHRGHKVTPISNTPINDAIAELLIHLQSNTDFCFAANSKPLRPRPSVYTRLTSQSTDGLISQYIFSNAENTQSKRLVNFARLNALAVYLLQIQI